MKKVLITGGTGFLGIHLARRLIQKEYAVTLFDIADLEVYDLKRKVTFVKGDIRNKKEIDKASQNQHYIVHAAAALPIQRTKQAIYSVNIDGTKNVLEAALKNKIKRLVFISTTAVYGVPKHLPEKENSPIEPIGFYGKSKIQAEKLCLEYDKKGLQTNIIRPKTFLGPERLGVFQLWFEAIYSGKRVFILGNGNNQYQLLSVFDVVDAIIQALNIKKHGEIFNIGAKEFTTWKKDLGAVIHYAKSRSKITGLPVLASQIILMILEKLNLSPIAAWHYKTMPVNSYVSIEKAEKVLKWHSSLSNKKLLIQSYEWYRKHRNEIIGKTGNTHRVGWNFKLLNIIQALT